MDTIIIRIRYGILIIGFLATIGLLIGYLNFTKKIELVEIFTLTGTIIALTGLIYTAINVNSLRAESEEKRKLEKQMNSFSLIKDWYSSQLSDYNVLAKEAAVDSKTKKISITKYFKTNSEHEVAILSLLNFFENIALQIRYKTADEKVLKDFYVKIFYSYDKELSDYIKSYRDKNMSDKLFIEFTELAKSWNQMM